MTRRTVAMSLGALVVVSATFVGVQTAHAGEQCTITNPHIDATHATFDVQGHCTVTLVSYELHGKGTLGEQTLYDSTTKEFLCAMSETARTRGIQSESDLSASLGVGSCTHDLTVTVPDCEHQVDLVLGQPRNPPTGYKPGEVLTWRFGGEGECPTPTTTTTLSTTTSTPPASTTTTSAPSPTTSSLITPPSSTANPSPGPSTVEVIGTPSTPTELPHTGGGELLSVALGALGLGLGADQVGRWRRARL